MTGGKAFARIFSIPRVLAWKRGPFCVYPVGFQGSVLHSHEYQRLGAGMREGRMRTMEHQNLELPRRISRRGVCRYAIGTVRLRCHLPSHTPVRW